MKVVPVKEKKDRILGGGASIKIIRQDDEEALLLLQDGRKKSLITNQVLILLGGFWRKEVGKLRILGIAGKLSRRGYAGSDQEDRDTNP
jgi:hypothetical protein